MSSESDIPNSTPSPRQRLATRSQKASLTRIVKAQVTLLISNLSTDNYSRKSSEIQALIETHGEDIREHLFRFLLADVYKQEFSEDSPSFQLLKENAVFNSKNRKTQAVASFGEALEQFCKSETSAQLDLADLFTKIQADFLDKIIFAVPLFSGVRQEISEQAKYIYSQNIQPAIQLFSSLESIPEDVLRYFLNAIVRSLTGNSYSFNINKLQYILTIAAKHSSDKNMIDRVQQLIEMKLKNSASDDSNNVNNEQLRQTIIEMYNSNPASVPRILELTRNVKAFPAFVDTLPLPLAMDIISLATSKNMINLQVWLKRKLKEQKESFTTQCLNYIHQKALLEITRQRLPRNGNDNLPISLSLDVMNKYLKVLSESSPSPKNAELMKEVQNICLQTFPKLMNVRIQATPGSTGAEVSFKPEIEETANSYYERIYNGDLSLDAMMDILKKFSSSTNSREQDIFACMIHNLFDEYLFFPKYPEKELSITSILFGSLIQHRLVSYVPLGIALRYVLDALKNPLGSKMFNFGVQALKQFQSRLGEWPQYCSHLLQISDLVKSQPDLVKTIQLALDVGSTHPMEDVKQEEEALFKSVHIPPLPEQDGLVYSDPADSIQDKLLFIINNIAQNNITVKVAELKQFLQPPYYKWFSNYMVVKRVSAEPNNHELYVSMLNHLDSALLYANILSETVTNIFILLNSDKTVSNSSERILLKNLGSWLGRITLAKNKPILYKYIAFKSLLLEGYTTNRLIVVIPFTCKVLEQCANSKIFRPPNPWLMGNMRLLVELYKYADLKLNLKFEIEVLCKTLLLDIQDITPTVLLRNKKPAVKLVRNAFDNADSPKLNSLSTQNTAFNNIVPPRTTETTIPIPNIAPYIVFNPQITLFATLPSLKKLVSQAITDSLRETITPVIDRTVGISVMSTRSLVLKDFMMEPDENKLRKAAHVMVQNLSSSLALVLSKEPLRLNVASSLRSIFLAHGVGDSLVDQYVMMTTADNMDLLCTVIEKTAIDKARMEIDDVLSNAILQRRKHREQQPGTPFVDLPIYQMSSFTQLLPQFLRPNPNGLHATQLSIYDDFAKIPKFAPNSNAYPSTDSSNQNNAYITNGPNGYEGNQVAPMNAHTTLEMFAQCISDLEKAARQSNATQFSALPPQSVIHVLIRQISMLALSSFDKAEAARTFAQKVVQLLYKSDKQLTIEIYVVLLEHLCEISPNVGVLVTSWLTHADDERKYNIPVSVALIKAGLINLSEQDKELAVLIEAGRASAIEFTARLIRACIFSEYPLATRNEFMASLEALSKYRPNQLPESALSLMEDLHKSQPLPPQQLQPPKGGQDKDALLREQLQFMFTEWVLLYQHPATTEKTMLAFALQLSHHAIFKRDDMTLIFYRVCIELSIDHAIKFKTMSGQSTSLAYQPIEAFSKLLTTMLKIPLAEDQPSNYHVMMFAEVLSIIVLCISHHHELRRQHFDQRPFLRLFTSILSDLHSIAQFIQPIYMPLLFSLSTTLHTLQPNYYPAFTFAWIQLISHRFFMPQLLLADDQKGWPHFEKLLVSLFVFLEPYLSNVELNDTTRLLYRGTLRILLVLLHDFPEFLCDYHYSLCDVIPPTCIQLHNIILSAFPRHMRLPDPFTPNLKIDLLPEIQQSPRILSDYTKVLDEGNLKKEIDVYLETQKPAHFLQKLQERLENKTYNIPLMNSVVLYVGTTAVMKGDPVHKGSSMEVFQYLLSELGPEGRYHLLGAIANQLRYPNNHTHYFSCIILYLFAETKKEIVKEQITRVLLERLIVKRPHPWGLLITFIELIKNPRYNFWNHSFTRCATDIERLFESVSRSINQT
ncbi:CCR4-Not complex component, Not1-domain-containing protein [Pilobolus umbonatus]|nr:CCR4-Not complex component, Not1-domain-containing protein [Pilobolus umbonatus]